MKIFFTGASSFSGFWFVKTLAEAGHDVTATFTRSSVEDYPESGFARARVAMAQDFVRSVWNTRMGDANFFEALEAEEWDVICLHGAYVADHKAADFPVLKAVETNTNGLPRLVRHLAESSKAPIVWTGTYFEAGEGQGTKPLRNFSPYALSKQLSWEYACYYAEEADLPISKFVMPNPFGPWEGKGFTTYLAKAWLSGDVPGIRTPNYVRDNIPVTLLALAYSETVKDAVVAPIRNNPSGFVSNQKDFAQRLSTEMSNQWKFKCPLVIKEQCKLIEPLERTNTQAAAKIHKTWDEGKFWAELALWYRKYLSD